MRASGISEAKRSDEGGYGIGTGNDEEDGEEEDDDSQEEDEDEPQESSGGLWDEVECFLNRPSPSLSALAKVDKKAASGSSLPTLKSDLPRRRKDAEPESSSRTNGRPTGRAALYQPLSKAASSKAIDPKLLQEAFAYAQKVSRMDFEDDQQEQADVIADRHQPLARSGSRHSTSAASSSASSFSSASSSGGAGRDGSGGPRPPPSHGTAGKKQSTTSSGPKSEESKLRKKSASTVKTNAYGSSVKPPKKKSERRTKEAAQWDPSNASTGGGGDGTSGESASGGGATGSRKHMDPQVVQSLVSNFQNGTTLDELRRELVASQQSMALSRLALQDAAKAFFRPSAH